MFDLLNFMIGSKAKILELVGSVYPITNHSAGSHVKRKFEQTWMPAILCPPLSYLKSTVFMQQNKKSNSMNIGSLHTFCTITKEAVQFVSTLESLAYLPELSSTKVGLY